MVDSVGCDLEVQVACANLSMLPRGRRELWTLSVL